MTALETGGRLWDANDMIGGEPWQGQGTVVPTFNPLWWPELSDTMYHHVISCTVITNLQFTTCLNILHKFVFFSSMYVHMQNILPMWGSKCTVSVAPEAELSRVAKPLHSSFAG